MPQRHDDLTSSFSLSCTACKHQHTGAAFALVPSDAEPVKSCLRSRFCGGLTNRTLSWPPLAGQGPPHRCECDLTASWPPSHQSSPSLLVALILASSAAHPLPVLSRLRSSRTRRLLEAATGRSSAPLTSRRNQPAGRASPWRGAPGQASPSHLSSRAEGTWSAAPGASVRRRGLLRPVPPGSAGLPPAGHLPRGHHHRTKAGGRPHSRPASREVAAPRVCVCVRVEAARAEANASRAAGLTWGPSPGRRRGAARPGCPRGGGGSCSVATGGWSGHTRFA